jgi:putative proteasome-type protease
MTFCIGLKSPAGLVALADTQIVRGSERLTKSKVALLQHRNESFFVMTSGLRSIRDKLMIYAAEALEQSPDDYQRLYQVANRFGRELQRIRGEDLEALRQSNLAFNLHAIIGGRLHGDAEPTLFFVYPEGNWIEASTDSPYFMIGRTVYGKPILDRLMSPDASLPRAAALAMLAFDATRTSVTDVDFPVDMLTVHADTGRTSERRYTEKDLANAAGWWQQHLREALTSLPMRWAQPLLEPDEPPADPDA